MNAKLFALGCSAVLAAGCGSDHVHVSNPPAPDPTIYEIEPNDTALHPDSIGPIYPGETLIIRGHLCDDGSDPFDGFAFISHEPAEISFTLLSDDPFTDLDLCVYDPFSEEYIACFENPGDFEQGDFLVHEPDTEFHLVLAAFEGHSGYTLEVTSFALQAGAASAAALAPSASRASAEDSVDQGSTEQDSAEKRRQLEWAPYSTEAGSGGLHVLDEQGRERAFRELGTGAHGAALRREEER